MVILFCLVSFLKPFILNQALMLAKEYMLCQHDVSGCLAFLLVLVSLKIMKIILIITGSSPMRNYDYEVFLCYTPLSEFQKRFGGLCFIFFYYNIASYITQVEYMKNRFCHSH